MSIKQELQKQLDELYKEVKISECNAARLRLNLDCMQNIVRKIEDEQPEQYGKWKPKDGDKYYYITSTGNIFNSIWSDSRADNTCWSIGNCYQTEEQALQSLERMRIRTRLEDIAERLNKDEKVDWESGRPKFYLFYDHKRKNIDEGSELTVQVQDVIYCLDAKFKGIAIQEIGEERLAKYLRGE